MKLEKVTINGIEYYQWVILATEYPYINTVGDIFTDWQDIPKEKDKLTLS